MMNRPEFIDNRGGNTLARALGTVLGVHADDGIEKDSGPPDLVRIATAFFSPAGFAGIADLLRPVPAVRLLLGADLAMRPPDERRKLDETPEAFERRRMAAGLRRMDAVSRRERDGLPFTRTSGDALRKLIDALRAGNMEVRRYEKAFLHAKAYIVTSENGSYGRPEGLIVGSSNLTGAGLIQNLELNLARYDHPVVDEAERWFDDLWDDAVSYDLAAVFEEAFQQCGPWDIFIRVLWQLYGDEVEEDAAADDNLPLTSFQKHGVARALRLIRDTGGVIVADEVGLGKTFIAGEILQRYRERRQRALLICPAALRDSTWKRFLTDHQLFVERLSFEQLANDARLRDAEPGSVGQEKLQRPLDEYQLVIVDEAHNYRNPDAPARAAVLRRLLLGRRRDLVLLTATPVNNSLWDLYHLLRFFLRQDAHLADRGILSIRARFEQAMREDPSSLSPDVLYPIIDATTVKRTRQFVKKHYDGDVIAGPDGHPQPIVFPQPKAISVRYNLDDMLPGFFDHLERALDPESGYAITFARYAPDLWLLERSDEEGGAGALVGLLRSGLLKRFESSAFAFRRTVKKMVREHDSFLQALDAGRVVTTAFMKELSADDDVVFEDVLAESENSADAACYDVNGLRAAVEHDRRILKELADEAEGITPDQDPKLRALVVALIEIARQAEREAADSTDEAQKRKVLVFSFFEDTISWIRDFLESKLDTRSELAGYHGRMVAVSGSDDLAEVSRQQAVQGFAPLSMGDPASRNADRYDLLLSTDVLAEGVNLQQCRHIINFDVPWNPMRLVQRHGRIDRIGSPHNRVFVRTIFPVDRLDRLLDLERRILDKLAMAAASVGVAAPIEGAAQGGQVFTETREEIEKLMAEDASLYVRGGTVGAAQTGEEYRQTLRKALEHDRERIESLPWKVGSGMRKGGARRGIFFCAVVGRESEFERTYLRFVAADGDWRPRSDGDAIERELGTCLRSIECAADTPIWYPEGLRERAHDFWDVAQKDILHDWMRETDPANLQPSVRPLNHRVAAFIRANPPLDMSEERLNRALDILESPWSRREEMLLRSWFQMSEHKGTTLSRFLIDQVLETGLEPVVSPRPLPPILLEDIELLCWMGTESPDDGSADSPFI